MSQATFTSQLQLSASTPLEKRTVFLKTLNTLLQNAMKHKDEDSPDSEKCTPII